MNLDKLKQEFKVLKEKVQEFENKLNESEKEYDFHDALKLAFENPGWVFYRVDSENNLDGQLKTNGKKAHNGFDDNFYITNYDLKHKWKRVV